MNAHTSRRRLIDKFDHRATTTDKDSLGGNQASRSLFALAELFGRLRKSKTVKDLTNMTPKTNSLKSISEKIREEYESMFWATGNMDVSLWADDCVFSDPFSSFGGKPGSTARFKRNADNLGRLVIQPKLKVTSFSVEKKLNENNNVSTNAAGRRNNAVNAAHLYDVVKVGWTFSSKLDLPWKPVLAAAGETTHYLDDRGLIVRYEERWKSDPWDVVKRLLVPT